eukprot:scaffold2180_cov98-Skeletonema_marinoi.AAC.4
MRLQNNNVFCILAPRLGAHVHAGFKTNVEAVPKAVRTIPTLPLVNSIVLTDYCTQQQRISLVPSLRTDKFMFLKLKRLYYTASVGTWIASELL